MHVLGMVLFLRVTGGRLWSRFETIATVSIIPLLCSAGSSSGDVRNERVKVCVNLEEKVRTRKGERGTG